MTGGFYTGNDKDAIKKSHNATMVLSDPSWHCQLAGPGARLFVDLDFANPGIDVDDEAAALAIVTGFPFVIVDFLEAF